MFTNSQDADEQELLSLLMKGDVTAFEKLYRLYSPSLYSNVLKMVKFPEIAEEILQDIFMRIWEKREHIDLSKSFKSYLFTIAKHLVYDFFNKQVSKRNMEVQLVAASTELYRHVEEEIAIKETNLIIANAICRLPPQRKRIYTLCKIEGKSYEEVSRLLGVSCSTISDHIVKATKFLHAYCKAEQLITLLMAMLLYA